MGDEKGLTDFFSRNHPKKDEKKMKEQVSDRTILESRRIVMEETMLNSEENVNPHSLIQSDPIKAPNVVTDDQRKIINFKTEDKRFVEFQPVSREKKGLEIFEEDKDYKLLFRIFRVLSYPEEKAFERLLILDALARSYKTTYLEKVEIESLLARSYPGRKFSLDNAISTMRKANLLEIKGKRYKISNTGITIANFSAKILYMLKRDSISLTLKNLESLDAWEKLGDDVGSLSMIARLIENVVEEMNYACQTGYRLKESAHNIQKARKKILNRLDGIIRDFLKNDPRYIPLYHTLRSTIMKTFSEVLENYSSSLEDDLVTTDTFISFEEALKLLRRFNLSNIHLKRHYMLEKKGSIPNSADLELELDNLAKCEITTDSTVEIEETPPITIKTIEDIPKEFLNLYPSELETFTRIIYLCKEQDYVDLSSLLEDVNEWEKAGKIIQDIEKLEEEGKILIYVRDKLVSADKYTIRECKLYPV